MAEILHYLRNINSCYVTIGCWTSFKYLRDFDQAISNVSRHTCGTTPKLHLPPKRTACSLKSCPHKETDRFHSSSNCQSSISDILWFWWIGFWVEWRETSRRYCGTYACMEGVLSARWVLTLRNVREQRYLKLRFQVEKFMAIIGLHWVTILNLDFGRCSIESIGIFGLGIGLSINQPTAIKNPAASSDVVITGYPVLKPPPRWYLFIFTPTWGDGLLSLAHIFQMSNENTLWSLFGIYRRLYYPTMLGL